jgi:hypothetical protein
VLGRNVWCMHGLRQPWIVFSRTMHECMMHPSGRRRDISPLRCRNQGIICGKLHEIGQLRHMNAVCVRALGISISHISLTTRSNRRRANTRLQSPSWPSRDPATQGHQLDLSQVALGGRIKSGHDENNISHTKPMSGFLRLAPMRSNRPARVQGVSIYCADNTLAIAEPT